MTERGVVYFVQVKGNGPVKVGYTTDMKTRMCTLQAWCPLELEHHVSLIAPQMAEWYAHQVLRPHRMRGEWFYPHPFVLNFIEQVKRDRRLAGCPSPTPSPGWKSGLERYTDFSVLIPSLWASRADLARACGAVPASLSGADPMSDAMACRIVLAARKLGANIDTLDFCKVRARDGEYGAKRRKPYKPRDPNAKKVGRKPFASKDFLVVQTEAA